MPTLGFFNPAASKDMMSTIWTIGGYNYQIKYKTLWEKEKSLVSSNFSFFHNAFKSCLMLISQKEYLWRKGLSFVKVRVCVVKDKPLPDDSCFNDPDKNYFENTGN